MFLHFLEFAEIYVYLSYRFITFYNDLYRLLQSEDKHLRLGAMLMQGTDPSDSFHEVSPAAQFTSWAQLHRVRMSILLGARLGNIMTDPTNWHQFYRHKTRNYKKLHETTRNYIDFLGKGR